VAILKEAPTTVVSKVIPIDHVVNTQIDAILEKTWALAREKMNPDDTFVVRGDLRGRSHIKSKEELIEAVSNELIDKLDESLDPQSLETDDPDWVVQIEVVGDDTGISILRPHQILKKK
jgi:tRNA acetyltransferase TAN1